MLTATFAPAPIALGIVGTGRIALSDHLPALRRIPRLRVVALCDVDPERLARAGALFPEAARYADHQALLQHPGLQAVGVLTPPSSHAEIALHALAAGLHVLIEKPLATSVEQCEALLAAATAAERVALVGYNTRWHRLARRARQLLQQGAVGHVQAIRSVYTHRMSARALPEWNHWRASSGGLLLGEAPHHYDLWRYLLGCEVRQVYATSQPGAHMDDLSATVSARLDDDTTASVVLCAETHPTSEVELFGDRGRLLVSFYRADGLQLYPHTEPPGSLGGRVRRSAALLGKAPEIVGALRRGGVFRASFAAMWEHFAAAIADGAAVECTLDDGLRSLQVALAVVQSASSGQPVHLIGAPSPGSLEG